MLAAERRQRILELVRSAGVVRVSELSDLLKVSDMTVRRDLERLRAEGLLEKVHGGAMAPAEGSSEEPGFEVKSLRQLAEKHALAQAAATLVHPGESVGIGAGTTTWVLARELLSVPDLTVVTNSVRIADVLRDRHEVVLVGGVRTPSDALVGPVADLALRSLHVDVVFLGAHGLSGAGLTTPNLAEAATNSAFIRAARRRVVVADATKWGTVGLMTYADLAEIDVLVTDDALPDSARDLLTRRVARLVVVPARLPVASAR